MVLRPTPKARQELHPGVQTLALRHRSVLLLAERRAAASELERLFHGLGRQIVAELLSAGYLAPEGESRAVVSAPAGALESP